MANTISQRIFDFLKGFPPYNMLPKQQLMYVSEQVNILYVQPQETVFTSGEENKNNIFIVYKGAIQLSRVENGTEKLFNKCDEGDTFGIRQIFGDEKYVYTAIAEEESLIYTIPISVFRPLMEQFPKMTVYLANAFAKNAIFSENPLLKNARSADENIKTQVFLSVEIDTQNIRKAITASAQTTIKMIAQLMTKHRTSTVVIIDSKNAPIGIVSDSTLRKRIAQGLFNEDEVAQLIMRSPAACVKPNLTLADVQIQLIKKRIRSVCVTEDGTSHSTLIGIISEHDLILAHGYNPAVILREIQNATDVQGLKNIMNRSSELLRTYLEREVSISFTAGIFAELYDALTEKAIEMAHSKLFETNQSAFEIINTHKYCWFVLGSHGRREQLVRTDQDNALIFENFEFDNLETTRNAFILFAEGVTFILNEAGFEYCKGNTMASNKSYCLSLEEWKNLFTHWISEPTEENLLNAKIFFDLRAVFGEMNFVDQLKEVMWDECVKTPYFLAQLAKSSLQNQAPLGFFRNFLVEKSGEQKNTLNIKNRAMVPITDAARLLALANRIERTSTLNRLRLMSEIEPQNTDLFQEVQEAYGSLMRFRALNGLEHGDNGRFINPQNLNKLERLLLRHSFMPIEPLQELIRVKFAL